MVIVAARVTTTPGKRDEFIQAAQECIATTRKEEGCISYELFASTEHPDKLMYYEHWVDRAALDKHAKAPHMAKFAELKAARQLQIGTAELGIFETVE